jgi:hypothetical protein
MRTPSAAVYEVSNQAPSGILSFFLSSRGPPALTIGCLAVASLLPLPCHSFSPAALPSPGRGGERGEKECRNRRLLPARSQRRAGGRAARGRGQRRALWRHGDGDGSGRWAARALGRCRALWRHCAVPASARRRHRAGPRAAGIGAGIGTVTGPGRARPESATRAVACSGGTARSRHRHGASAGDRPAFLCAQKDTGFRSAHFAHSELCAQKSARVWFSHHLNQLRQHLVQVEVVAMTGRARPESALGRAAVRVSGAVTAPSAERRAAGIGLGAAAGGGARPESDPARSPRRAARGARSASAAARGSGGARPVYVAADDYWARSSLKSSSVNV